MNEEENLTPAEEAETPAPEPAPEEPAPASEEEEAPKGKKGRKKGKKEKKPKAKKEKKPREKKPKKKKKGDEDGEEPQEGEGGEEDGEPKKKGLFANKKLLLIILIGVVVLAGVAVFLLIRVFGVIGGDKEKPPKEAEEVVETETPEETEELSEDPPEETPAPTATPSGQIRTGMTTVEIADYIRNLTPSSLGLPGEDMTGYDVFVSESLIVIDGHYCTQVTVYSDGTAGTNEIEGVYYISRDSAHLLYRYDVQEGTVTPITP